MLQATEWTAYTVESETAGSSSVMLEARAEGAPAEAELVVGDRVLHVNIPGNTWTEIKPGEVPLIHGTNCLKWVVRSGKVDLDWMDIAAPEKTRQAARLSPIITPHAELP